MNFGLKFDRTRSLMVTREILKHSCSICPTKPEFPFFMALRDHMASYHRVYFCELCVNHLNLFSWERKYYDNQQLIAHGLHGDLDDKRYLAHPLCQFCSVHYMDDDTLYEHLRIDHFFCHFCDAEGKNVFVCDLVDLKSHFKEDHFLCEQGSCNDEPFEVSFNDKDEFQKHQEEFHGPNGQKQWHTVVNYQSSITPSPAPLRIPSFRPPPFVQGPPIFMGVPPPPPPPYVPSTFVPPQYVPIFTILRPLITNVAMGSRNGQQPFQLTNGSAPFDPNAGPSTIPNGDFCADDVDSGRQLFRVIDDDEVFPSATKRMTAADAHIQKMKHNEVASTKETGSFVRGNLKKSVEQDKKNLSNAQAGGTPSPSSIRGVLDSSRLTVVDESAGVGAQLPPQSTTKNAMANSPTPVVCATAANSRLDHRSKGSPTDAAPMKKSKPNAKRRYLPPPDFSKRNRILFDTLKTSMLNDADRIESFKKRSLEFQRGEIEAANYRVWMQVLIDDDSKLSSLVNELLGLLPKIECQQRLLNEFKAMGMIVDGSMKECGKCGQWLLKVDVVDHDQRCP